MRNTVDRGSVQAVERAADLLLLLATATEPPSLRDLSQQVGHSPSTVLRLLTALEKKGLVERDPGTRRYAVGVRVVALASGRLRQLDLPARAQGRMRALRDLTGETVTLHVPAGTEHVCVAEVEGVHDVRRRVGLGRILSLERGSTGKVFRASAPGLRPPELLPERPETDGLPRSLEQVRAAGYAVSIEEREAGVSGMSAPIYDATGRVQAALTVSGPSHRFGPAQMRALADPLREAAHGLSMELGYDHRGRAPQ
jgi:DNA-binding IclR family transcriptional regulator